MKVILPIFVILAALGVTGLLIHFQPEPNEIAPERPITSVEIITAHAEDIRLHVTSQGTVLPKTEVDLYAEVSGQVIEVSDSFRTGGRFRKGETLLQIDPVDYEAAVAARSAEVATAQLQLAQERALSEQAAADWKSLGEGDASELTLRKPQLAQAQAAVESAKAQLAQAKRNRQRATVQAPFDGRILSKSADLGQYIAAAPASPVARIYATDQAEVRLPLTEKEATFLDLSATADTEVHVRLPGDDATVTRWTAQLDRLEATIDPESRLLYAVAVIDSEIDPADVENRHEALRRGQFVIAEIEGREAKSVYPIPRYALRGSDTLYILTDDNTLVARKVEILKSDRQQVILSSGIEAGDRIAISPIAYFVDNMPVNIVE